ncbi:MAG: hypothetical protein U1E53_31725 [Dongiaceae bacterium]
MRADMAKIIVERPRRGGGPGKGRPLPLEERPAHEGMRRRHALRGQTKSLNENLSPLRRYLERQVGRPWAKVHAEIARHLRVDSTVQQHVRDHVAGIVALTLPPAGQRGLWWPRLYVDPRDGLLKRTDRRPEVRAALAARRRRPAAAADRVPLGPDREARRIDGLWYEVRLSPLPDPVYAAAPGGGEIPDRRPRLVTPAVRDAVTGAAIPAGPPCDERRAWVEYRWAYPDRRYASAKRMLSRAELRRCRLSNAPDL